MSFFSCMNELWLLMSKFNINLSIIYWIFWSIFFLAECIFLHSSLLPSCYHLLHMRFLCASHGPARGSVQGVQEWTSPRLQQVPLVGKMVLFSCDIDIKFINYASILLQLYLWHMEIMEERNIEHFMLFLEISKSLSLIATLKCVIYPHFTNVEQTLRVQITYSKSQKQ